MKAHQDLITELRIESSDSGWMIVLTDFPQELNITTVTDILECKTIISTVGNDMIIRGKEAWDQSDAVCNLYQIHVLIMETWSEHVSKPCEVKGKN